MNKVIIRWVRGAVGYIRIGRNSPHRICFERHTLRVSVKASPFIGLGRRLGSSFFLPPGA